ncbi:TolC family outer membrane protein [Amorphus orientalis]|uniref:Outer membrane protein n=1 Tax=Amorphus orientalis TaxID=649198 RepID=A0AAE3VQS8_9HYPH|nr:TolC family outer membrane protein [Amorphus orientalis]MDQ0316432.1 outer membrane protein [Amorphus orientalis]
MTDSLSSAYSNNPQLNQARAQLRSIDENVAIAKSAIRPQVFANLSASSQYTSLNGVTAASTGQRFNTSGANNPLTVGMSFTQPIFTGFQTKNTVLQAKSAVRAQRELLRDTEQAVLLDAATAFQDVIQNASIVRLRQSDVSFLDEQVKASKDRLEVGEGTRTDVSQAEARYAEAVSDLNFAEASLASSKATYRQITGLEARDLVDNLNLAPKLPPSLNGSLATAQDAHPAIQSAVHNVDVALFNVKALSGQFLPEVSVTGQAGRTYDTGNADYQDSAQVSLNVDIPIYQGGRVSAQVRQAKEDLGYSRIQVDLLRDRVRQNVVASWSQYQSSVASIQAARTGVFAQQLALQGVIEEQRVGQRTTLDVLNAQRDLVSAQVTLVQAERNKAVAAYALLSATGQLGVEKLGLRVVRYQPTQHYEAVKDKWYGLRTPDGR